MAGRFDNASVKGLSQVKAAFRKLPDVAKERYGDATRKTVFAIMQRARARVPVRYGFLKKALSTSYSDKTGEGRVGLERGLKFSLPNTGADRGGKPGVAVPSKYGHLVEFGHGGPRPAAPSPFMIPSAEAEKEPYLALCRKAGKLIEQDMAEQGGRRF